MTSISELSPRTPVPLCVIGKVQMVWGLRNCGSIENDGPLSNVAEHVFNVEMEDAITGKRAGTSRIGVFLYDAWAMQGQTIRRNDSLHMYGAIMVVVNDKAEMGDHQFCLVIAEPELLVKANLLDGITLASSSAKVELRVDSVEADKRVRRFYSSDKCTFKFDKFCDL